MASLEKKYLTDSFIRYQIFFKNKNIPRGKKVTEIHYYAPQSNSSIIKFVTSRSKYEIHILEVNNGVYRIKKNLPMENSASGFLWLKNKGFTFVDKVKIAHFDFKYQGGIVGCYLAEDFLKAVILTFTADEHEKIEKEMGIAPSDFTTLPFTELLKKKGKKLLFSLP